MSRWSVQTLVGRRGGYKVFPATDLSGGPSGLALGNAAAAIRVAMERLPPDTSIPVMMLPSELAVAMFFGGERGPAPHPETANVVDLTVDEVAALLNRAASTVRSWCHSGKLKAYRLNGREYRITHAALAEFQTAQRERPEPGRRTARPKIDEWKNHSRAGAI